jgi:primosomal replication protein N''
MPPLDERDVVVFSTTFGRNEQGAFRRNFGALGQAGGERRLNVAVTRARKKIVIMTSMPVAKISDMLETRRPPAVPRDYLQAYLICS